MNAYSRNWWTAGAATAGLMIGLTIGVWVWPGSADEQPYTARFDVMIESGDAGPKTHPCATDPQRNCFTFRLERK